MKNMKRALSLVLTVVMLLGMIMVPSGAAGSFADADLIENTEAVQITSGIGLFAGTTDGNFAPKATVTRAQMATIIVKMLRGSDFNADAFKGVGVNPFPDTAEFEGGWAEGYINACSQLGVVAGYGDGTFKPGKAVTTAEALTMIINALGVDPGPGEWPMTYMAKAEEMKLYGELAVKPGTNAALTRDQLAVIAWEGLKYSPAGKSGYKIPGSDLIFTDIADAVLANRNNFEGITEAVGQDSLASKVYEIKTATGWITGNAATGKSCTVLTSASGVETNYAMETGVDMLGHYATVYYKEQYKNDEEPGLVYTIVDESTVVTVKEAIYTAKEYKAAFGKSINVAQKGLLLGSDYAVTEKLGNDLDEAVALLGYTAGSAAPKGTYIIAEGAIVAYIAPIAEYVTFVSDIETVVDHESVQLNGVADDAYISNAEGDDLIVEYAGMAVGDFVTFVKVRDIYVLSPVTKVSGELTKTFTAEVDGEMVNAVTMKGKDYYAFTGENYLGRKLETNFSSIRYGQNYDLYVTGNGRFVGFETAGATASLDNTLYLLGSIVVKEKDQYGVYTFSNKGRGTDMEGNEVMILLGQSKDVNRNGVFDYGEDDEAVGTMGMILEGFYTVEESTDRDAKQAGVQVVTAYPAMYSPETPTYTSTSSAKASAYEFSGNPTSALPTLEGIDSYGQSTMKFIVLGDNTLNQSAPLDIEVYTGSISPAIHSQKEYPLLVTRASTGVTNLMEALVIKNSSGFGNQVYVYITEEQLANPAYTLDGKSYMAYTAGTGKEEEYVLGEGADFTGGPGFYLGTKDDDETYRMVKAAHNQGNPTGTGDSVRQNQGFLGVSSDRLYSENLASRNKEGYAIRSSIMNSGAAKAKVVDARTQEEIDASGVPEITTMNQLINMRQNNPEVAAVVDVFMRKTGTYPEVLSVYVTRVERKTAGLAAMVYATKTPVSGDKMLTISSLTEEMGELITVNFDTVMGDGAGFYYFGVNAEGELTLYQRDPSYAASGSYGVMGMHNLITAVDVVNKKLTTVDDTAYHLCDNTCIHANEAKKTIYVTDQTKLFKADGSAMSFEELVELNEKNNVVIDYYCASTAADAGKAVDETAEVVMVYATDARPVTYDGPCSGDHTGWTELTNASAAKAANWSYDITTAGKYYLTEDITANQLSFGVAADVEITLCLNGHSITSPIDTPLYFGQGKFSLCNCGGDQGGIIKGSGARSMIVGSGGSVLAQVDMYDNVRVSNATLSANASVAAAVAINKNGALTMYGGSISNNKITNVKAHSLAAAVSVNGGKLVMKGGEISGNTVTMNCSTVDVGYAAAVYATNAAQVDLQRGAFIQNNTVSSTGNVGGGILAWGSTVTMSGGTISGNTIPTTSRTRNGGGIALVKSTLNMSGGTISANTAVNGGGVWAYSYDANNPTTFNMSGGTISANRVIGTNASGGGVLVSSTTGAKAVLNMTGGNIVNNVADTGESSAKNASGGGVCVAGSGEVQMTGGRIRGNSQVGTSGYGGGVAVKGGIFNMGANAAITGNEGNRGAGIAVLGGTVTLAGEITGNTTANNGLGGGIHVMGGTVNIAGATITNNTAQGSVYGGGLSIQAGTVNMTAGTISGNTANANGYGVEVASGFYGGSGGVMNISGGIIGTAGSTERNLVVNAGTVNIKDGATVNGTVATSGMNAAANLNISGGRINGSVINGIEPQSAWTSAKKMSFPCTVTMTGGIVTGSVNEDAGDWVTQDFTRGEVTTTVTGGTVGANS